MLPLHVARVKVQVLVVTRRVIADHQKYLQEDDQENGGDGAENNSSAIRRFHDASGKTAHGGQGGKVHANRSGPTRECGTRQPPARLQAGEHLRLPQSRPMPAIRAACNEPCIVGPDATWRIVQGVGVKALVILDVFFKKTHG